MAAVKFATQRVAARSASPVVRALFDEMRRKRISIESAAEYMSMTYVGLCYWKSGRSMPRIDDFEILAAFVDMKLVLKEGTDATS
jgi:hypothetical protein